MVISSIETDLQAHHHHSTPHNQQQHIPLFQKGEPVEVTSNEEGFAGSWFPATIVDCSALNTNSTNKKRKKVVIRFDTLLNEDGRTPLTESVDPAFVRKLPPADGKHTFEVNDVVDVRDKDGWWAGVVAKVLEAGNRYRVVFDNPPDSIDYNGKDLRSHWDWISGAWIRPHKLPSKGEEDFVPGEDVEVNLQKETVGDIWLPGVVIKRRSDQSFSVKCQGLDSLDDAVEVVATKEDVVVVDSQQIRPTPPCHSRTDYELMDHVDGLIAGSWQKGLINKVTEGKYTVYLQHRKEEREFSISELRPHLDWDNGEWISTLSVQSQELSDTEMLDSGDISAENRQLAVVPVSTGASYDNFSEKTPCSSTTRINMDDSSIYAEKSASDGFTPSNKKVKVNSDLSGKKLSHCNTLMMEGDAGEAPLSVKSDKATSSKLQNERLTYAKSSPDWNQLFSNTKKRQANLFDRDCDINAKMGFGTMSSETSEKLVITAVTDEVGAQLEPELESTVPRNGVENSDDASIVGATEGVSALVSTDSDAWPFVKKSALWAPLESMDIFKNLPQTPHFHPLNDCEEKYREGAAIGVMVFFENLFKEIPRLTIDNPRSSFENSLKSLSEIEEHGFDVSVPRGRIHKLLSIRNLRMESLAEVKNAERELNEQLEEKRKLEAVVKELEDKLAAAKGEMEGKKVKTAVAQAQADKMKGRVVYANSEFERVSKSPWK